ncbi:MAG TPA: hypothetical protein VF041_10585 [Gemmatimonadaceae bacterium]
MTLEHVRPLIVPASYATVGVPAAMVPLRAPDLALTWVELAESETMTYVTPARAAEYDRVRPDWRRVALDEMRRADDGLVWTHEKRVADGSLLWVAMMHDDGLGSSRLLLAEELRLAFPSGYLVAIPDRSCGVAIARDAPEIARLREMVADMHAGATTPMIPDLREPAELLSPSL